MAQFLVRRTYPFARASDIDAAVFRALVCTKAIPGMTWLRSYFTSDMKSVFCLYEARSAEDVERHSMLSRVPFEEIMEVGELTREQYWTAEVEEAPALV